MSQREEIRNTKDWADKQWAMRANQDPRSRLDWILHDLKHYGAHVKCINTVEDYLYGKFRDETQEKGE